MKKWMIATTLSVCAVFAEETFEMNADSISLNVENYTVLECTKDIENHEMTISFQNENDTDRQFLIQVVKSDDEACATEATHIEKIEGHVPMELHTIDTETTRSLRLVFTQSASRYSFVFNMEKPIADGLEDHYRSVIDSLASTVKVTTIVVAEEACCAKAEEVLDTESAEA